MSRDSRFDRARWHLADIIDYELLIEADTNAGTKAKSEIAERDDLFRQKIVGPLSESERKMREGDSIANRRWWLYQWLQLRSGSTKTGEPSIGEVTVSGLASLAWLFAAIGFLGGLLSLCGLLAAPVVIHVPMVLLIYLGPQVLFIALAVIAFIRQRIGWTVHSPAIFRLVVSRALAPLVARMIATGNENLGGDPRTNQVLAALGLVVGRGRLHREALSWPLLSVIQGMALSFSVAIALGMLVLAQVSHFNFGWAATNNAINADVIYRVVKVAATPWSKIFPEGEGFPSLEEVRRSQTFRSQPLSKDFPTLSSWWSFLVLSLVTYACVPRALLLGYSLWREYRALACEAFKDRRSDKLFRQLARPKLEHSVGSTDEVGWDGGSGRVPNGELVASHGGGTRTMEAHCMVFTELELSSAERQAVEERIFQRLGFGVSDFLLAYTTDQQKDSLEKLRQTNWTDGIPRVLLLYRSSDPIVANFRYFCEACLEIMGEEGHLLVALVGRSHLLSAPADPDEISVWREHLDSLKLRFPNVELEILTDSNP